MGTATHYDPALTLRQARERYFADNDFGPNGGYDARWVKVSLGPVPLAFPNSAARVRAVRYHDLHHVLTGYATDLHGEAEIGAWEVASGCRSMLAAWVLNLAAMGVGLLFAPRAVRAAFLRGRHSRNLYGATFDDALLERPVGEQRRALDLDRPAPSPTAADRLAFAGWSMVALGVLLVHFAVLLLPVAALVWWLWPA